MSEKHYPYFGGSFDRIVFDGDDSVWVPESETDKLRELVRELYEDQCVDGDEWRYRDRICELGIEV